MNPVGNDSGKLRCDFAAIKASERQAHRILATALMQEHCLEKQALSDGSYAFRFKAEDYLLLTQFIDNERLCCSFLSFELHVTPQKGAIWPTLRGGAEGKDFLASGFTSEGNVNVEVY